MIIPQKWYNKKSLRAFRDKMTAGNLRSLVNFKHCYDVFDADIGGGVCYFLYDKLTSSEITTVTNVEKDSRITRNRPLKYNENFIVDNIFFDIVSKIPFENRFKPLGKNVFRIGNGSQGSTEKENRQYVYRGDYVDYYFSEDEIYNSELGKMYKIVIGTMNPDRGGANGSSMWNVINVPKIYDKYELCQLNYLVLYASEQLENVKAYEKVFKTKFIRFLILQGMQGTSLGSDDTWRFVPNIDLDEAFNIQDKQLYRKYNLTQEEIDYIEKTIKTMK